MLSLTIIDRTNNRQEKTRARERERKKKKEGEKKKKDLSAIANRIFHLIMLGSSNPSTYLLASSSRMFHDEIFSDDNGKRKKIFKMNSFFVLFLKMIPTIWIVLQWIILLIIIIIIRILTMIIFVDIEQHFHVNN